MLITTATFTRLTDANAWMAQEEAKIRQGIYLDRIESTSELLMKPLSDTSNKVHHQQIADFISNVVGRQPWVLSFSQP